MTEMPPRTCPGQHLKVNRCEELIDQLKQVSADTAAMTRSLRSIE